MSAPEGNPFWAYSLALYGREGVEPACLALQDRYGLEVNLLLFCCWAGSRGRRLSPAELESLASAGRAWREAVVEPLRQARRWLKGEGAAFGAAAEALRQEIKASELAAEAIQQETLHRSLPLPLPLPLPEGAPSAPAVAANLRAALVASGQADEAAAREALAALLCAACPGLGRDEALGLLAD